MDVKLCEVDLSDKDYEKVIQDAFDELFLKQTEFYKALTEDKEEKK